MTIPRLDGAWVGSDRDTRTTVIDVARDGVWRYGDGQYLLYVTVGDIFDRRVIMRPGAVRDLLQSGAYVRYRTKRPDAA